MKHLITIIAALILSGCSTASYTHVVGRDGFESTSVQVRPGGKLLIEQQSGMIFLDGGPYERNDHDAAD